MVLWRGVINKQFQTGDSAHKWRNVYTIQANDAPTALAALDQIRLDEQTIHSTEVYFTTIAVYSIPKGAGFKIETVNALGNATPGTTRLPFFIALRVDFLSGDGSRPERKYLRLPCYEENTDGLSWLPGVLTNVTNNYATPVSNNLDYVGPHGEPHAGFVVHAPLQMRQTGWHRHARKGFHRGYIPNA